MSNRSPEARRFAPPLLLVLAFAAVAPARAIPLPWRPAARFELRDATGALAERLDRMTRPNEPGFAVMVLRDSKPVLTRFSGVESLETGAPINAETRFYVASIAKSFTATAVLMLRERGQLRLEDPVSRWIDRLPAWAREVRLHHLLNHTSGIADYLDAMGERGAGESDADVLAFVRRLEKLEFEPGVQYAYSNTGYVLLAAVIERASGKPYEVFLRDNIFGPLGMTGTVVVRQGTPEFEHRARGYRKEADRFVMDDYRDVTTVGSGGVYSTLQDLARWYQAVMESRLLKPRTAAIQFTPPVTLSGDRSYLGMGWSDETFGPKTPALDGLRAYASIGLRRGFTGMIQLFPDHQFGWIILRNSSGEPMLGPDVAEMFFRRVE